MSAVRNNEELWEKIKTALKKENSGRWNARMAQRAVQIYKASGGTYAQDRSSPARENTSLAKWTREDWGYVEVSKRKSSGSRRSSRSRRSSKSRKSRRRSDARYLPRVVREALTPSEAAAENRAKRGKRGQRVPYRKSTRDRMKAAGIF
jgi:hypothetical protein